MKIEYVTSDGKRFDDESKAIEYENTILKSEKAKEELINKMDVAYKKYTEFYEEYRKLVKEYDSKYGNGVSFDKYIGSLLRSWQ